VLDVPVAVATVEPAAEKLVEAIIEKPAEPIIAAPVLPEVTATITPELEVNEKETINKRFALPKRQMPQAGALSTISRKAMRSRGNIIAGVITVGVVGVLISGAFQALNPAPSASEVAAAVTVKGDTTFSGYEGAGSQFLTAYLTYSADPDEQVNLNSVLDTLTNNLGSGWRSQPQENPKSQIVIGSPALITPLIPSATIAGGVTGIYRVFIQTQGGKPKAVHYSVTVVDADTGGTAVVPVPPGFINASSPTLETAVDPGVVYSSDLGNAAAPGVTEFLKLWAQAGPDADPSVMTQLDAWLAPDATVFAKKGLAGAFTFGSLDNVQLEPFLPASDTTSGQVTVKWVDSAGRTSTQRYSITVKATDTGGVQVTNIGPG
jgi:hypothetical protein